MTLAAFLSVLGFLAKHYPEIAEFLGKLLGGDAEAVEQVRRASDVLVRNPMDAARDEKFRGVLAPPPDTTPGANFPPEYEEP